MQKPLCGPSRTWRVCRFKRWICRRGCSEGLTQICDAVGRYAVELGANTAGEKVVLELTVGLCDGGREGDVALLHGQWLATQDSQAHARHHRQRCDDAKG